MLPVSDLDFNTSKLYAASLYCKIFFSVNDGQNWTEQNTPVNDPIFSIAFLNEKDGIAVTDGKVLYTGNGGNIGLEETNLSVVRVFPNPANGFVQLEAGGGIQLDEIKLLTTTGQQVRDFDASERTLSLEGLPAGQYILQLKNGNGAVRKKVVVL